ncbi:MAG: hypothetical protein OER91_07500 [Gammaproteobacteria bacterium]|nr:hypothetical protein [Gammaproteobacteria bacterium]
MQNARLSRRRFVLTALAASAATTLSPLLLGQGRAWAEKRDPSASHTLARALLPHAGLADDVYADVMDSVFSALATSPSTATLLDTAEAALDAQQSGTWIDAADDAQIEAVVNIQGEPFFAAILATLRGTFYYHPEVWKHIDYPGSSKEYGGYLNRGFNDIAWLQEVE